MKLSIELRKKIKNFKRRLKDGDEIDINLKYVPQPKQKQMHESDAEILLYGGAVGGGKVVSERDNVLSATGWQNCKDLKVGQNILNPDGSVQRIIQLKPWVELEKWTVYFSDGTFLEVAKDHLWKAWKAGKSRKIKGVRTFGEKSAEVVETQELKEWLERGYYPQVPVNSKLEFCRASGEKDQLDPYLLGLILGDGCTTSHNIDITGENDDLQSYLLELGIKDDYTLENKRVRFTGEFNKFLNKKFITYKLKGKKSNSKFVPQQFLWSSSDKRLAVLQGLMDTDGHSCPDKNQCEYATVSQQLCEDVCFIVRSLGGTASVTTKIGSYKDDDGNKIECQKVYRVWIQFEDPDMLFRLKRKHNGKFGKNLVQKRVVDVKVGGAVRGRCITVSNPNGLYITNDFIVTHNSAALVADVSMYALEYPGSKCGLFRKTKNSARAVFVDEGFYKFVPTDLFVYNENKSRIEFINGSVVEINSLDNSTDKNKYQGDRWRYLGVDEVTLFRPGDVQFLETRCRSEANPDGTKFPRRIRYTANPGGPSHAYMKRIFIDRDFTEFETPELYDYIFSNVEDNKYLKEDVGYYKQLMAMPDAIKKRFYDGDWSIGEGVFLDRFDPMTTVVTPFDIPSHWRRYRAMDYGYTDATVVGWFAISPSGAHYMYKELSVSKMTVEEIAKKIEFLSIGEDYIATYADPSVFASSGIIKDPTYRSAGLVFKKFGINLIPANNDRRLGGMMMREFLSPVEVVVGDKGETVRRSKLMIFNSCKASLSTIPHLVSDPEDPDDIEHGRGKKQDDHAYDMIRYYLASHAGAYVSYEDQVSNQQRQLRDYSLEAILNEADRRTKYKGDLSIEGLILSKQNDNDMFNGSKDKLLDRVRKSLSR